VSWQQLRNPGKPIYEVDKEGTWLNVREVKRVLHHSIPAIKVDATRCVRFRNRWHPLHEPEEWIPFLKKCDNEGTEVFFRYPLARKDAVALPFVLSWEESGLFYEVFGY
jgi:hypothetical protein